MHRPRGNRKGMHGDTEFVNNGFLDFHSSSSLWNFLMDTGAVAPPAGANGCLFFISGSINRPPGFGPGVLTIL